VTVGANLLGVSCAGGDVAFLRFDLRNEGSEQHRPKHESLHLLFSLSGSLHSGDSTGHWKTKALETCSR